MSTEEITLEGVGQAVKALREELAKPNPNQEVLDRVNVFLDAHEEKVNQPLTQAALLATKNEGEVKDLKEALEKKGVEAGETRARVDALELELARNGGASSGVWALIAVLVAAGAAGLAVFGWRHARIQ